MKEIKINTEYITLGKVMKYANMVDSGAIAKILIKDGEVIVNGEVEMRRGKKLYQNDEILFDGITYKIVYED